MAEAQAAIAALGLHWQASEVRGGLVACTGNAGCKFAASVTKRHAAALALRAPTIATSGRSSRPRSPISVSKGGASVSSAKAHG